MATHFGVYNQAWGGAETTKFGVQGTLRWFLGGMVGAMAGETYCFLLRSDFEQMLQTHIEDDVMLNRVKVMWYNKTSGAAPGKYSVLAMDYAHTNALGLYTIPLDIQSSGALVTTHLWEGNIPLSHWISDDGFNAAHRTIFWYNPPTDAITTNDDIYILVEGTIIQHPSAPEPSVMQSVSVEGYKWPLTRR